MLKLPFGKVPPELLEMIVFPNLGTGNKDVILGPARGEDAAIVRLKDKLLVMSCDPVSGSVERVGWLAVNVSANDVATCGVKPRWLLICILLPDNYERITFTRICEQINNASEKLGVAVVGGHSEISPGLDHPIIISCCIGVAEGKKYLTTSGAKPGSKIILTKGVGIEGTGILATDRKEIVVKTYGAEFASKCAKYFEEISVVPEALAAAKMREVYALHDPTEGGVLGGLWEMADASECGFTVFEEALVIRPETKAISELFKIDPLRLISSGSLLISVKDTAALRLIKTLQKKGIPASIIGDVTADKNRKIFIKKDGSTQTLSRPESDDLWKALKRS